MFGQPRAHRFRHIAEGSGGPAYAFRPRSQLYTSGGREMQEPPCQRCDKTLRCARSRRHRELDPGHAPGSRLGGATTSPVAIASMTSKPWLVWYSAALPRATRTGDSRRYLPSPHGTRTWVARPRCRRGLVEVAFDGLLGAPPQFACLVVAHHVGGIVVAVRAQRLAELRVVAAVPGEAGGRAAVLARDGITASVTGLGLAGAAGLVGAGVGRGPAGHGPGRRTER